MPLTSRRPLRAPAQGRREVSGIRLGDSRAKRQRSEAQGTTPKLGIPQEALLVIEFGLGWMPFASFRYLSARLDDGG